MERSSCKQADIWMAALESDNLSDDHRIRLLEHTQRCAPCRQRSRDISRLKALLAQESPRMMESRQRAIWQRVNAESVLPAQPSPPSSWRSPLAMACAAAGIVVLGAAAMFFLASTSSSSRHGPPTQEVAKAAVAPNNPPVTRPRKPPTVTPQRLGPSWRVVTASLTRINAGRPNSVMNILQAGDQLAVANEGQAVLLSRSEMMVVEERTRLSLPTAANHKMKVRLHRGQIAIRSQQGMGHDRKLVVAVDRLSVRPTGTAFSVVWDRHTPPRVAVLEGSVQVTSSQKTINVKAGMKLVWGGAPTPLSTMERFALAHQLDVAALVVAAEKAASVEVEGTPAPQHIAEKAARPRKAVQPGDRRQQKRAPQGPSARLRLKQRMLSLERMLNAGQAAQARKEAEELLAGPHSRLGSHAPTLMVLVAESYLKQNRPLGARDAYLRLHRKYPRTALGRDAIFTAGQIELEQLSRPQEARGKFQYYLDHYKTGRQREGAYYLLHLVLHRLGKKASASVIAARYRAEYPKGQYLDRLVQANKESTGQASD